LALARSPRPILALSSGIAPCAAGRPAKPAAAIASARILVPMHPFLQCRPAAPGVRSSPAVARRGGPCRRWYQVPCLLARCPVPGAACLP
jgi:hypothetical protein